MIIIPWSCHCPLGSSSCSSRCSRIKYLLHFSNLKSFWEISQNSCVFLSTFVALCSPAVEFLFEVRRWEGTASPVPRPQPVLAPGALPVGGVETWQVSLKKQRKCSRGHHCRVMFSHDFLFLSVHNLLNLSALRPLFYTAFSSRQGTLGGQHALCPQPLAKSTVNITSVLEPLSTSSTFTALSV